MKVFFVSMLLLCLNFSLRAQMKEVSGTVMDANNKELLIGASIGIKGSTGGTLTDVNGAFKLKIDNSSSQILIVRYIGYKQIEVNISGKSKVDILLEKESLLLNEVVSIGYATIDRRDVTGAISSVSERQLNDIPISSVEQALTGRLAGVQVTTSEGTPDAEVKIRVRGGNSITQDNAPIYVIDGVQVEEGLKGLAVQDIESIDVLKDASSTSIYGARGANGVVIITTKKGLAAKTKVNYNPIFGVSKVAHALNVQSPLEFILYQDEKSRFSQQDSLTFMSRYGTVGLTNEDRYDYLINTYKNYPAIDWQDLMFGRSAPQITHNLSVSGGNKDTRLNLGYTFNDQDGVMLKSAYRRDLINLRLDHNISNKLKVGAIVRYSRETINGAGVSSTSSSTYNLLRNIVKYQPIITSGAGVDEYDEEYFLDNGATNFALINPMALNNAKELIRKNNMLNLNGNIEYKFNQALSFKSTVGFNFIDQSSQYFDSEITPQARFIGLNKAMAGTTLTNRKTFNNSNVFNYSKTINKIHRLNVLLGHEVYNIEYENTVIRMRYFPKGITADKALSQFNLGTAEDNYPSNNANESKSMSFFTRANYTYKNRYLLTASLRADGSSKFAPSNRWGYFPAASAAWQISREAFMKNITTVTDLKLRVSYGLAGNNRIQDYMYSPSFMTGAIYDLNGELINGYYYPDLFNKDLKWEKTTSRNLGLDMTLFKGLRLSIDAYSNLTNDLLINAPIPSSTGYARQLQNVGKTANKGIEIQVGGTSVRNKEFVWSTDFNIAFNRNKVRKISSGEDFALYQSGVFPGPPTDYILKEGSPVGLMYGYATNGFYTVEDFNYNPSTKVYSLKSAAVNATPLLGVGVVQPGAIKFKDINDDKQIDAEDMHVIGNSNPKFSGGLNNQFKYKNFDLSVFVNFVYGNDVYNASKIEFTSGYGGYNNLLDIMNDRWRTVDNQGIKVQWVENNIIKGVAPEVLSELNANAKIWQPGRTGASAFIPNSWAIEDGSFLRLNNVTLGYTVPEDLLRKIKVQALRLYVTGTNLALWTNYTGYDPEVDTRRTTPLTPSVDYSAYPRSRSFLFGINLTL